MCYLSILVGNSELRDMVRDLQHSVAVLSGRLIKQLKRRDRYIAKLNKNQDVLTAVLQAVSQKRRKILSDVWSFAWVWKTRR